MSVIATAKKSSFLQQKIADYAQLVKVRLSFFVVFSAAMSYLWATNRNVDTQTIWLLSIGGFLITACSNILNQIIERKSDKLMKRTANRPLPAGRMTVRETGFLALLTGLTGLWLLSQINMVSSLLGLLAIVMYAGVYTPMKKVSSVAIIPGAIAGSIPVIIGWTAAFGTIQAEAIQLFGIQFIWQFPHTWSIAWLLNDEYNKAGLKMLPLQTKSKTAAILIFVSTFLIIPSVLLLYMYESAGIHVTWVLAAAAVLMMLLSYKFYVKRTDKAAVALMLSCFAFLPFLLITLVIEKFL